MCFFWVQHVVLNWYCILLHYLDVIPKNGLKIKTCQATWKYEMPLASICFLNNTYLLPGLFVSKLIFSTTILVFRNIYSFYLEDCLEEETLSVKNALPIST